MVFYASISQYYDHIFPFNPRQLAFIQAQMGERTGCRILDIGCATGNLAWQLVKQGHHVHAIDMDPAMIAQARRKGTAGAQGPWFEVADMRALKPRFSKECFEVVLCFGNTLVHLLSVAEIAQMIADVAALMSANGIFLLQILNYDFILDEGIRELPLIENEHVRFERVYHLTSQGLLEFQTCLTVKATGQRLENMIMLLPLRRQELLALLRPYFVDIACFGDLQMNPPTSRSFPLIVKARRKDRKA